MWAGYAYGEEQPHLAPSMAFLRASGLKAQIRQIPKSLLASLPADTFADAKTKNRVEKLFYAKVDTDEWTTVVAGELAKAVDAAFIDELIRFYSSRVGRKLAAVNEGALNHWHMQRVREGYSRVAALSDARLALLKALAETTELERFNAEAVDTVVRGLLEGYVGPSNKLELTKADTEETFQHSRKIAGGRTGELCLVSLANSLSPLSDQDLAEVHSFLKSPPYREAQWTYQKALQRILRDAAYALGESLREAPEAVRNGGTPSK